MGSDFTSDERALLVALQSHFPLIRRPFAAIGERLGRAEADVIAQAAALKSGGTLRQIGPIFDTWRLGYASTLVALEVASERLDAVAAAVSAHPGVSHNYARNHKFNLWFTLAMPPQGRDLEAEAAVLAAEPGVNRRMMLPTLRTFKIDVRFDFGATAEVGGEPPAEPARADTLQSDDVRFVRALQEDLPLLTEPFAALAAAHSLKEEDLLEAARRFLAGGIVRRYGATLRHREAGYTANAMVCWDVSEAEVAEAGRVAAEQAAVSHCYERPVYPPDWPYRLFTMMHRRSETELASAIEELHTRIRPRAAVELRTVKEYKKIRLRYFEEIS